MPAKLTQKQIVIIIIGVALLGLLYWVFTSGGTRTPFPDVKLTVWGVVPEGQMRDVFDAYTKNATKPRQKVSFTYRQFDESTYRESLVDALAAGQGPDIFMMKNTWLPMDAGKVWPASVMQGNDPWGLRRLTYADYRNLYPQVVEQDFIQDGQIYAVPLSMDTLAMVYNLNALDRASIVQPPATWDDVEAVIPYLRTTNESGQLTQAAVAIGGSEQSMSNVVDIISALMLQNGQAMPSADDPYAHFVGDKALAAFQYYLQFANAVSPAYTWNDSQPHAPEAVASGRAAIAFAYHREFAAIKAKNPFATIRVAPFPQIAGTQSPTTFPSYWGLAVARQSTNWQWAFDFTAFLTEEAGAKTYAQATGELPALRSLIANYYTDPDLGPYARQALLARSWREPNEEKVNTIFDENVRAVLLGQTNARQALERVSSQLDDIVK